MQKATTVKYMAIYAIENDKIYDIISRKGVMYMQKFIVSRDDSIYEAWPDVVLTDSGKLICVFAECEHHLDRNNARIAMVESTDRGRTWSDKRYLTEKGTKDNFINCPRISKLPDGRLAVICDRINGDENAESEICLWYGDSEGKSWGEPVVYPFCGIVPDKLICLESGRMIIAAQFKNSTTGKIEQYMWYSDDNGKTWSDRVTIAAHPDYNLCEVSIIQCENNTLVAFMRENSFKGFDVFKSISYDGGESWSDIITTPLSGGHRPVSGYLNDGTVMITYRYFHGGQSGAQNVFAAFLDNDSLLAKERSEHKVRIMPLDYDRNPAPDLGYTGWVQFPDGEIYVVNYIKDDSDKAHIRGYSFYMQDALLPEDSFSEIRKVF